jgi:hypothetical protein
VPSTRGLLPAGSAVGSCSTFSPLPSRVASVGRSILCCTFLEVSFTGRYPASCPAEPGLSSKPCGFAIVCVTNEPPSMTRGARFSQSARSTAIDCDWPSGVATKPRIRARALAANCCLTVRIFAA